MRSAAVRKITVVRELLVGRSGGRGGHSSRTSRSASASRLQVRIFSEGWTESAARFAPEAIAGTYEQLRALTKFRISSLTHALIVLRRATWDPISEDDRDWLWRNFGVPVYEQVIGPGGELWAAECPAHDGLHVESPMFSLGDQEVVADPCCCGRKTPRILVPEGVAAAKRMVAYAR